MRSVLAVRTGLLLVIVLALGGGAALVARNQLTVGQDDPCFGLGELVSTRTYTVSDAGAANAKDIGLELTPGEEREVRECHINPLERVTIDGVTGKAFNRYFTIDEGIEYYRQHPEELPATRVAREFEEGLQESFVTPQVPVDLTAGCDPSWVRTTLEQVRAVVCHPADWMVDQAAGSVRHEGTVVSITMPGTIGTGGTKCTSPLLAETPFGQVRICALVPNEFGQGHGVILPSGREAGVGIDKGATPEDRGVAFRMLANIEILP